MSTKEETTECGVHISKRIVKSEMVAQQSQPPKPIKAEDIGGPSKIQIPPNPKQNVSSEMRQNIVTISNKV